MEPGEWVEEELLEAGLDPFELVGVARDQWVARGTISMVRVVEDSGWKVRLGLAPQWWVELERFELPSLWVDADSLEEAQLAALAKVSALNLD